jgi:hypothetical protein
MPSEEEIAAAQEAHAAEVMTSQAAGGPPPQPFDPNSLMRSSIQPEESDFQEWEAEECREFLSDWPKVQEQITAGNQAGIMNVRLHWKEHMKFVAANQAAMMAQAAAAQPARPGGKEAPPKQQPQENQPPIQ